MKTHTFLKRTLIQTSAAELFAWHAEPGALERLSPPWEKVEIIERVGGIKPGARVVLHTRIGPLRVKWVAEHVTSVEGREFSDRQVRGPFAFWEHSHRFIPEGPDSCWLEDEIHYGLPLGWLGRALAGWYVRRKLERLFEYRHAVTVEAFAGAKI